MRLTYIDFSSNLDFMPLPYIDFSSNLDFAPQLRGFYIIIFMCGGTPVYFTGDGILRSISCFLTEIVKKWIIVPETVPTTFQTLARDPEFVFAP